MWEDFGIFFSVFSFDLRNANTGGIIHPAFICKLDFNRDRINISYRIFPMILEIRKIYAKYNL